MTKREMIAKLENLLEDKLFKLNTFNFLNHVGEKYGEADFYTFDYIDSKYYFNRKIDNIKCEWPDPDSYSEKLYQCHEIIWNLRARVLHRNFKFALEKNMYGYDLLFIKNKKETYLGSDYIGFSGPYALQSEKENKEIIKKEDIGGYYIDSRTFGGHLLFPKNPRNELYKVGVNQGETINQARGSKNTFFDRIDLTLKAIQEYYNNDKTGVLYELFQRFHNWFDNFDDFNYYVDFFFLQDFMETEKDNKGNYIVKPLASFETPFPKDYRAFIDNNNKAINKRNKKIIALLQAQLHTTE